MSRTVEFVADLADAPEAELPGRRLPRWLRRTLAGLGAVGALSLIALAAMGLWVVTAFQGCEDIEVEGDPGLLDLDIGPGQGTSSRRLEVDVTPRAELRDGSTVFVTSDAFRPWGVVGVAVCLEEAGTQRRGVDACDTINATRFAVDGEGRLAAAVEVSRVITVGERAYDCAARAERCIVVAADSRDYDLSGGQPVSFAEGLGRPDLTPTTERPDSDRLPVSAEPAGAVAEGTVVEVTASGFVPGEPVIAGQCSSDFLTDGVGWMTCMPFEVWFLADIRSRVRATSVRADATGVFRARIAVERYATDGDSDGDDRIDCARAPGRCGVVVAAAADTRRSAYHPLTVTS